MVSNQTPRYYGANCCVVGCHRDTVRDKGKVNFFNFPTKNQEKRQLWIKAVNRSNWEPKKHTRICSDHFVGERHREERDHPDYQPSLFPTSHIRPSSEVDLQCHGVTEESFTGKMEMDDLITLDDVDHVGNESIGRDSDGAKREKAAAIGTSTNDPLSSKPPDYNIGIPGSGPQMRVQWEMMSRYARAISALGAGHI